MDIQWHDFKEPPFSLEWGVMNFQKYLSNIFVTPYFLIKNFMTPPPRSYNVKENVTPMWVAWNICILMVISLNKIFIKILATQ